MSQDRFLDEERGLGSGPTCTLAHALSARRHYCGRVRAPERPDELGAVVVVELLFGGGRRAFFRREGTELCDVRDLDGTHAPGAEAVHRRTSRQPRSNTQSKQSDAGPLFGGRR